MAQELRIAVFGSVRITRAMPVPLPLKEQIISAARMALRCHTHLALWKLTAGAEGRAKHREVLDEHWEHIRFLEHGQLFTAVIELHSLLDANAATINLPHLTDALEAEQGLPPLIREALAEVEPIFAKLRILRNGVYAHRTKRKAYPEMFKQAAITPDQLQELGVMAIKIANALRGARQKQWGWRPKRQPHCLLNLMNECC